MAATISNTTGQHKLPDTILDEVRNFPYFPSETDGGSNARSVKKSQHDH